MMNLKCVIVLLVVTVAVSNASYYGGRFGHYGYDMDMPDFMEYPMFMMGRGGYNRFGGQRTGNRRSRGQRTGQRQTRGRTMSDMFNRYQRYAALEAMDLY